MAAGGEGGGIELAVVDGQIIQVLKVGHEFAGDGGGALSPGLARGPLFIHVVQVDHVAGEPPAGGTVHIGGGKGVEAQLRGAGVDVLHDGLQRFEVGDLVQLVAGLLEEVHIDDDAVALIAVADGAELAVLIIDVVGIGVQLVGDLGAGEIQAVVGPGVGAGLVAHDEQGGRVGLVHLSGQGLRIGAGSGGDHVHGDAGLLGVELRDLLKNFIGFGLEVQPVDGAILRVGHGDQSEHEAQNESQSKDLLHCCIYLSFFYSPSMAEGVYQHYNFTLSKGYSRVFSSKITTI